MARSIAGLIPRTGLTGVVAAMVLLTAAPAAWAGLVTVEGRACHTYGDDETPAQAERAAIAKAQRRGVASHKTVVRAVSEVEDFELRQDVARSLVAGALRQTDVLEVRERGREVCARVRGKLDPEQVDAALKQARQRAEQEQARSESGRAGVLPGDARCRAYLPATVSMKQPLGAGTDRAQAREKLIGRMLMEAARQRSGALVRGTSEWLGASQNGEVQERFMARFRSQSRGLVKYSVVRNAVTSKDGRETLAMTIDARVCVPREPLARMVAVTRTRSTRGQPVPELRHALEQAFGDSEQFAVVAREGPVDIALSAEIINVGLLSVRVTEDDLPPGKEALSGDYHRLVTTMAGQAQLNASGERVTHQLDAQELVPARRDEQLATESFVKTQMRVLAKRLRDRVAARLTDKHARRTSDGSASDDPRAADDQQAADGGKRTRTPELDF